jgi:hypothetical protein
MPEAPSPAPSASDAPATVTRTFALLAGLLLSLALLVTAPGGLPALRPARSSATLPPPGPHMLTLSDIASALKRAGSLVPLNKEGAAGCEPFRLPPLTPNNTAFALSAVGSYDRFQMVMVAAHALRRVDPVRAIVIHCLELPSRDFQVLAEEMRVTWNVVPAEDVERWGRALNGKCGHFEGCWLKIFAWSMVDFAAVIYVDNDYIATQPQDAAFDDFAAAANTPYDVGGVTDLVVGYSHWQTQDTDVFNSGWFVAIPGAPAFARLQQHALDEGTRWKWGEMLMLNSFPSAAGGKWVRMPVGYNVFPMVIRSNAPFFRYDGVNWGAIYGLHFAGVSKVLVGTTAGDCGGYDGKGDSTQCCLKWVEEERMVRALLDKLTLSKWAHAPAPAGGEDKEATLRT